MAAYPRAADNALHTPVLLDECLDLLAPALAEPDALLIDCTLGMGGHAEAFLETFPQIRVVGIDRDRQAIELASERLAGHSDRFLAVHTTYDEVATVAATHGRSGKVDAILMDLGVSSLQLDDVERGFSYAQDAPLDMRMDSGAERSAADILAEESEERLAQILHDYSDERYARRIARNIVRAREATPIERTGQLVEIIRDSIPAPARRTGGNPAKRTFQALRIAVNDELAVLKKAIVAAIDCLAVGGRIAVESYQSLEDTIVKRAFAEGARSKTPARLPVELDGHEPYLRLLTRGALKASEAEAARNPRSTSVRLRAAERIREGGQSL